MSEQQNPVDPFSAPRGVATEEDRAEANDVRTGTIPTPTAASQNGDNNTQGAAHTTAVQALQSWVEVLSRFGTMTTDRAAAVGALLHAADFPKPSPDAKTYLTHAVLKEVGIANGGDRARVLLAIGRMPANFLSGASAQSAAAEPSSALLPSSSMSRRSTSRSCVLPSDAYSTDPTEVKYSTYTTPVFSWTDLRGKDLHPNAPKPKDPNAPVPVSRFQEALEAIVEAEMEPEIGAASVDDSLILKSLKSTLPLPQVMVDPDHPHRAVVTFRVCSLPVEADDDTIASLTNRWTLFLDTEAGKLFTVHRMDGREWAIMREDTCTRASSVSDMVFFITQMYLKCYVDALADIGAALDGIESKMLSQEREHVAMLTHLFHLQRRGSVYERMIDLSARMILEELAPYCGFQERADTQLRPVLDRLNADLEETLSRARELLNIHMSLVSYRTNNLMTALTKFTIMFTPLSFLSGLYGMNFTNFPELQYENAYFILLGVMGFVAICVLSWFRWKGY